LENHFIGGLEVLANNFGVYSFGPLESVAEAEFQRRYNANVLGTLLAAQEAVKLFGGRGGRHHQFGCGGPNAASLQLLSIRFRSELVHSAA
jgi:NAD(P)-dependent dehydrogenase (short-subunit alcohol dehydrogenase family)